MATATAISAPPALSIRGLNLYYAGFQALKDVNLDIPPQKITAFIGPSGCGKSSLLRCMNRMNDLIRTARVEGEVLFHGENVYAEAADPTEIRFRIGMVFQKPNPFPKSIYDNVAFGPKLAGYKGDMGALVERCLRQAALWDEVKDRLKDSAYKLSGGQQQRLCIARTLALDPEVILMDEPCSSLDPIATLAIEELMRELAPNYTIVLVTHNMQQAARVSDYTTFLTVDDQRSGYVVEFGETGRMFSMPREKATEDYITGRFG